MREDEHATVAAGWLAEARAAWPEVAVDAGAFVAATLARLPGDATVDQALAIHVADLWLAAGCAAGDTAALAAFDASYITALGRVLGSTGLDSDQIAEVKQEVRKKLLVADGDVPRIAEYSGRADLHTWLRTVAVRTSIDLIRKRRDVPIESEELEALPGIADDPELAHMKERYRGELGTAIAEAIGQLVPRDRLLLKYHYIDGLSIDRIGTIYAVHRATAARWVAAAREALGVQAQQLLSTRLGVTTSQLRSIARLVESQLDLSIQRLLT